MVGWGRCEIDDVKQKKQKRSKVHLPVGDGDVGVVRLSSRSVVIVVGGGGGVGLSSRFVVEVVVEVCRFGAVVALAIPKTRQ